MKNKIKKLEKRIESIERKMIFDETFEIIGKFAQVNIDEKVINKCDTKPAEIQNKCNEKLINQLQFDVKKGELLICIKTFKDWNERFPKTYNKFCVNTNISIEENIYPYLSDILDYFDKNTHYNIELSSMKNRLYACKITNYNIEVFDNKREVAFLGMLTKLLEIYEKEI
jgi:hypothetical protein